MNNTKTHSKFLSRDGNIVALTALMLPFLLIISAMAINISYMQLTRTELMVATDAAARAGGRAVSNFQNIEDAKVAAQVTAALNNVSGKPLQLDLAESEYEIAFGDAVPNDNSNSERFEFTTIPQAEINSGAATASAIQVHGKTGTLPSILPIFLSKRDFTIEYQATAVQVDRDIALILDRSGSMDTHPGYRWPNGFNPWSTSSLDIGVDAGIVGFNNSFNYYFYQNGHNWKTYQDHLYSEHLGLGDAPKTPWEELGEAVDVFLNVLDSTDQEEQVSLASYATTATLDINLVKNYDLIRNRLEQLGPSGWTAIGEGMNTGIPSLLDNLARPFAAKTLVVLTDGVHNRGIDPDVAALNIVNAYDVTIHTVTFGGGADRDAMREVARIGGGDYYHAATGDDLRRIFEEIANNLPTIVVQ